MPDRGSTLFVPSAVGQGRAFQIAMLGERLGAEKALESGLINFVFPDDELIDQANDLVEKIADGPTRSYAGTKARAEQVLYPDLGRPARPRGQIQHALGRASDFMEGAIRSWRKRAAAFTGA